MFESVMRSKYHIFQLIRNDGRTHWANGLQNRNRLANQYAKNLIHLPWEYVIHTVGPIWQEGNHSEAELLANCYFNSLKVAAEHGISSVAFPSISTGVYRFPVERAAAIAVDTVFRFLETYPNEIETVEWVLFDEHTFEVYQKAIDKKYR